MIGKNILIKNHFYGKKINFNFEKGNVIGEHEVRFSSEKKL